MAHVPVLMFTAKTLVGDKVEGLRAGADDYLTKPIHPAELASRVEALLHRSKAAPAEVPGTLHARTIGVIGAKGGVGTSTLAVNLAVAACQYGDSVQKERSTPVRASIADMQAGLGSVAILLGETSGGGLATLMKLDLDNLDQETVEGQLMTHASGLRFLSASLQPEIAQGHLPVAHVDAVLTRLAKTADYLYQDLGSVLDEATCHAITRCDVVIVVVEPERVCLTLAKASLDRIHLLDPQPDELCVVMIERVGAGAAYSPREVENMLGLELASAIEPAGEVARQAVEQGTPIVLMQPESRITEQILDLNHRLLT